MRKDFEELKQSFSELKIMGFIYNVAIQKLIDKGLIDDNEIQEKVREFAERMSSESNKTRTDEGHSGNGQS